ncbi:MAG: polysaccharide deacetylase family protein [Planctomycetota bacterium]
MIPEIIATAAAAAAGTAVAIHGIFASRSCFWGPLTWRGDDSPPARVALTFDDGPHPEATPRALDLLAKAGARAAFFLVGMQAEKWPAIVKRIVDEGHLIGNHSWSHSKSGGYQFTGYWESEIVRTASLLEQIAGVRPAWFRPPYVVKQWHMHRAVRRCGNTMITYTERAFDGVATTPEAIVARLVPRATAGAILTLHDGVIPGTPRPIEPTLAALPNVIEGLRARGLAIAPLDELIAAAPYAAAARAKAAPSRIHSGA